MSPLEEGRSISVGYPIRTFIGRERGSSQPDTTE
jgi:hypothetical protein